jgi:hypothetical protein
MSCDGKVTKVQGALESKLQFTHYSGMKRLGSGDISWLQGNSGAGVYFNP